MSCAFARGENALRLEFVAGTSVAPAWQAVWNGRVSRHIRVVARTGIIVEAFGCGLDSGRAHVFPVIVTCERTGRLHNEVATEKRFLCPARRTAAEKRDEHSAVGKWTWARDRFPMDCGSLRGRDNSSVLTGRRRTQSSDHDHNGRLLAAQCLTCRQDAPPGAFQPWNRHRWLPGLADRDGRTSTLWRPVVHVVLDHVAVVCCAIRRFQPI